MSSVSCSGPPVCGPAGAIVTKSHRPTATTTVFSLPLTDYCVDAYLAPRICGSLSYITVEQLVCSCNLGSCPVLEATVLIYFFEGLIADVSCLEAVLQVLC